MCITGARLASLTTDPPQCQLRHTTPRSSHHSHGESYPLQASPPFISVSGERSPQRKAHSFNSRATVDANERGVIKQHRQRADRSSALIGHLRSGRKQDNMAAPRGEDRAGKPTVYPRGARLGLGGLQPALKWSAR